MTDEQRDEARIAFGEMTFDGYFAFAIQHEGCRQIYIDETGDPMPPPLTDPDGLGAWIDRFKAWSKADYMKAFEGKNP